jgi:hypothetical protein
MFIPDPGSGFFNPGSRIEIFPSPIRINNTELTKSLSFIKPKKLLRISRKYDPRCLSRIRIFFHPGSGSATLIKKTVRAEMRKSTGRLRRGRREGDGADP